MFLPPLFFPTRSQPPHCFPHCCSLLLSPIPKKKQSSLTQTPKTKKKRKKTLKSLLTPRNKASSFRLCRKESPKSTIMSANGVSLSFLLLLLLANPIYYSQATTSTAQVNGSAITTSNEMVPLKVVEMKMMLNISRRRLNGFQICAPCTCCGGAHGTCLPSPCCYAINCNIPNRPFGFCSFTPKTCNCFGCHL